MCKNGIKPHGNIKPKNTIVNKTVVLYCTYVP